VAKSGARPYDAHAANITRFAGSHQRGARVLLPDASSESAEAMFAAARLRRVRGGPGVDRHELQRTGAILPRFVADLQTLSVNRLALRANCPHASSERRHHRPNYHALTAWPSAFRREIDPDTWDGLVEPVVGECNEGGH
jgi:hypothetical protein